jgi:hypothetical protein
MAGKAHKHGAPVGRARRETKSSWRAMTFRRLIHLALLAGLSLFASLVLAFGMVKLAQRGLLPPYAFETWWTVGKYAAVAVVPILPPRWIHGDPASETYWPAVSSMGFVALSAVIAWSIIIFAALLVLGRYGWPRIRPQPDIT